MAKEKLEKTNAIRALDKAKLTYMVHTYENDGTAVDGVTVAQKTGLPVEKVYKTLVTVGHSREHYVFVIPVAAELDLKAAARSVGEKSVEMIHVADINKLTGYIRGGCSPVGMKKAYPTVFHETVTDYDTVYISAGKIGAQVELAPGALLELLGAETADLIVE
mgnify:CR=1 FL=1